ncbi:MAG: activator of (R)-2-hydroxyglutaryl-CoA dehydratase [Acidobacteriia bacterium]|nr:activator of (R)-2-hydroxyglutaryl-CoA dehydratase [Terriglobia bacterium]
MERGFTADQRHKTTLLFGGLTWKHEKLVHGALEGLGYRCEVVPTPDVKAFQLGKEYGNNGQCNPTYFTVGNVVQYLQKLEESGIKREDLINNYVFLTAGACGPCRFGMYEAEYRLALRNSGYDGFRVMLFQQSGGLNQSDAEAGLCMNLDFFLNLLNSLNMGDIINEVAYQIRPFELEAGATDAMLDEVIDYMHEVLKKKSPWSVEKQLGKLGSKVPMKGTVEYLGKFLNQLYSDDYTTALEHVRGRYDSIKVDRFRVKPIVKITGEFWAQTTEGDGNFNMFHFLEKEGAQIIVEPIGTWIMYMIHQVVQKIRDTKGLEEGAVMPPAWRIDKQAKIEWSYRQRLMKLKAAEVIFAREYHKIIDALGGTAHRLVNQYELQRLGHPYYNSRAGGGEGHLEVAKNIYYSNKELCHMVLSLKPFGCMPSTQSDGAQSAVVAHYKDMIFLPIETSGEGEINAHSRVQMALGEAKAKAKLEFKDVLEKLGKTVEELKAYVAQHPEMETALYHVPKYKSVIGTAANFAIHVAEKMGAQVPYHAEAH